MLIYHTWISICVAEGKAIKKKKCKGCRGSEEVSDCEGELIYAFVEKKKTKNVVVLFLARVCLVHASF